MIGIFDSGAGGLSVLREIRRILPGEDCIYYSDNAHCPYGDKPREYITDRARHISEFLMREGAQIIVVACNTATAASIASLREEYSDESSADVRRRVLGITGGRQDHVRFIGMEPAVKLAARETRDGVVGVLATAGTLHGEKYINTRDHFSAGVTVVEHVGEGFVELVEKGETSGRHAEEVVAASLRPLLEAGADTIVLGCTHYPFLRDTIASVSKSIVPGRDVVIIDPAPAVAHHLLEVMREDGILDERKMSSGGGNVRLVSSGPSDILRQIYSNIQSELGLSPVPGNGSSEFQE